MIWLVGSGIMSRDYAKVLDGLKEKFIVIGRGEKSAQLFRDETGKEVVIGGVDKFLGENPALPNSAIISVGVGELASVAVQLIQYGVKKILLEKPGALKKSGLKELQALALRSGCTVVLGYNRRFYSSVLAARKIIEEDGGLSSFNFEFTEWGHIIEELEYSEDVLNKWFIANSTHVVDLAFYLGGKPKEIQSFVSGSLKWHKSAAVFGGAGVTESGAIFSYQANWGAPGRWGVELLTRKHRLYLRPMELLQIQELGSIQLSGVPLNCDEQDKYKPGLFEQVRYFLSGDIEEFCDISDQLSMTDIYCKMAGYNIEADWRAIPPK